MIPVKIAYGLSLMNLKAGDRRMSACEPSHLCLQFAERADPTTVILQPYISNKNNVYQNDVRFAPFN